MSKTLGIGDEESAILILQQSQDNPQKALAELVQNSIDAKAKNIQIIRRKRAHDIELLIIDDGKGVAPGLDGNPDFDRVARQICDSMKKYLSESDRAYVQGQYGIGLLGFAAIGESLEMLSKTGRSKTMRFALKRGSINYESGISHEQLEEEGTKIKISPVHKEIKSRLTAEKINAYLGQEMREMIKTTHVSITVDDRLPPCKKLVVKPLEYKGERIRQIDKIMTPSGNIQFKLFVVQEGESGRVSVLRRGTRIVDDVAMLQELDHYPWSSGMVEGDIDDRFLNISPATRKGIIPDQYYSEFLGAVLSIEKEVVQEIKKAEAIREEKLSRDLLKSLQEAFAEIMQDLEDYDWFEVESAPGVKGKPRRKGRGPDKQLRKKWIRYSPDGLIDSLTVSPSIARMIPRERKDFIAKAWTSDGSLIPCGIEYKWKIVTGSNLCSIACKGNVANLTAESDEGDVVLQVAALQGSLNKTSEAKVFIYKKSIASSEYPFPNPVGEYKPGEPWRSHFYKATNELKYNSGHLDYQNAKKRGEKALRRYMAFLYSKELVLHNFSQDSQPELLERMIEVISALETRIKV